MKTLEFKRNDQVPDHELLWPSRWTKFGSYPTEEIAEARAEQIQASTPKWVFRIRADSPSTPLGQ